MKLININTWNRKQHYEHFVAMSDPYFALVIPFNVTKAYAHAKEKKISFFAKYLHDCMRAVNAVENLKYRIENNTVFEYDIIHASATLMRKDNTFGFSFIEFDYDFDRFNDNIESEKTRIQNTRDLYPAKNGLNCIHCSAMPWLSFTGHKEPVSGILDSVPKIGFAKMDNKGDELTMNISISVNHALVDGYHLGLFAEKFQGYLNE